MSKANQTQVAGTHYRSTYQHWDFVLDERLPYLEGQVTKYTARHRLKNGEQDVDKALHYAVKLEESFIAGRVLPSLSDGLRAPVFAKMNRLTGLEESIMQMACDWVSLADLQALQALLLQLKATYRERLSARSVRSEQPVGTGWDNFGRNPQPSIQVLDGDAYRNAEFVAALQRTSEADKPPVGGGGDFAGGGATGTFDSGEPSSSYTNQDPSSDSSSSSSSSSGE